MTTTLEPFDSLAPCGSGIWTHGSVTVARVDGPVGDVTIGRDGDNLHVSHTLTPGRLSERLVEQVTAKVAAVGSGRDDFEAVMVGLVRSTVDGPVEAWATYYRNSIDELIGGTAAFAPIHHKAESLIVGDSVLDLGSCFGFFPLRLALRGVTVTATDIHEGTVRLLDAMRAPLGVELTTLVCDAGEVPVVDGFADTVTALHLLEHVDEDLGDRIVREALRVARRRVVVAVPFENEAQACHGHVRTFDLAALEALAERSGVSFEVFEHHGGWAVLDAR
ncbi:MAG: mycofactocin oligosaccharide methyltransferase MftM [Rhodococcus sp. (in: high G+C Gram-positive bacteria)]